MCSHLCEMYITNKIFSDGIYLIENAKIFIYTFRPVLLISHNMCYVISEVKMSLICFCLSVKFVLTNKAESFYNVNFGLSTIMPKSTSKNFSNQNKHLWWYYKNSSFWHFNLVLSWAHQKHQRLLSLLRLFNKLFDVIIKDP